MKTKALQWRLKGESLYATGVNCEYSIHPENDGLRLFITEPNKRPLLTDFKTFEQAMHHAQEDITRRVKWWVVKNQRADDTAPPLEGFV